MNTKRRQRQWSSELADWRCYMCDCSADEIGKHPLPVRQRAHLLPNRLTGSVPRYGGVKNPFRDREWTAFLEVLGPVLQSELHCTDDIRAMASSHSYEVCGECHEEILSEPVYLPSVMEIL